MASLARILLAGACFVALPVAALPSAALAAPHASSHEAQALLDKAVTELQTAGPEKAFEEFNNAKGPFKSRELYVFVFSLKGVYEASGGNPKLVGTTAPDLTDVEGKPLVREMISLASEKGNTLSGGELLEHRQHATTGTLNEARIGFLETRVELH